MPVITVTWRKIVYSKI